MGNICNENHSQFFDVANDLFQQICGALFDLTQLLANDNLMFVCSIIQVTLLIHFSSFLMALIFMNRAK